MKRSTTALLLALLALATLVAAASAQAQAPPPAATPAAPPAATPASPPVSAPAAPLDAKALGRSATAQFYAGEFDALWERFSQKMKDAFKGKEPLRAFRDQVDAQAGAETG